MDAVSFRIGITDEEELDALEALAEDRPDVRTEVVTEQTGEVEGAIAPVVAVLVGGVTVAFLSELVWDWVNRLRGGLVVDLRESATDRFSRDRDVPYGYVVTHAADGSTVTLETKDAPKSAMERLLSGFIDGTLKNVKDIVAAAKQALGDDKVTGGAAPGTP